MKLGIKENSLRLRLTGAEDESDALSHPEA